MHVRNYLRRRDDSRAKIICPIMQRCELRILNDPERPTYTRSNSKTIIDFLFSRIPASMWLIHINRTSHRMISSEIKRKVKKATRVISAITIPVEGFEESLHKYIEQGMPLHMTLVATLRDLCGTSRRFKPIPQLHPYDTQRETNPMQFFRTFKAFKRVSGPLNKPTQERWQRFLTSTFTQGEPIQTIPPGSQIYIPSTEAIAEAVKMMNPSKAPGPDGVSAHHLKQLAPELIQEIFISWAQARCIPPESNSSEIIPIHKSGDPLDPSNYRPISLINNIVKLYELTILRAIENRNEIIAATQYGAIRGRSSIL